MLVIGRCPREAGRCLSTQPAPEYLRTLLTSPQTYEQVCTWASLWDREHKELIGEIVSPDVRKMCSFTTHACGVLWVYSDASCHTGFSRHRLFVTKTRLLVQKRRAVANEQRRSDQIDLRQLRGRDRCKYERTGLEMRDCAERRVIGKGVRGKGEESV
jgi:hypothetical protein